MAIIVYNVLVKEQSKYWLAPVSSFHIKKKRELCLNIKMSTKFHLTFTCKKCRTV